MLVHNLSSIESSYDYATKTAEKKNSLIPTSMVAVSIGMTDRFV